MTGNRPTERDRRQRTERPRTISVRLPERGQTTQDFAVGIGIFLLAIAFVFSFLPTVVTPYDSSVSGAETAQADRIADRIVSNASTDRPNEIDESEFERFTSEDLQVKLGLRSAGDNVNVTIHHLENETRVKDDWAGGDRYDDQAAATSARIVTFDTDDCDPACRLVVRVW